MPWPKIQHALVVAGRTFGTWLASVHILFSVSFAKSVAAAAVGAGIAALVDLTAHN